MPRSKYEAPSCWAYSGISGPNVPMLREMVNMEAYRERRMLFGVVFVWFMVCHLVWCVAFDDGGGL